MSKKKVKAPTYQTMADTPYITRNRELNENSYNNLNDAIGNLNSFDSAAAQQVVDDYMDIGWDQLNRDYNSNMNKLYQRNYNRLGTLGSSSGLYTQDDLQRSTNNLASNMANQAASMYNTLKQQEYNNRLNNVNLYNNLFNTSGEITQDNDLYNNKITNRNIQAKYMADVQNAQNSGWNWGGMLSQGAQGAATGATSGGGLVGGILGGLTGAVSGGLSGSGGQSSGQLGSSLGNWFTNKYGSNYGNF